MAQRSQVTSLLRQYATKRIVKNSSPVLDNESQMSNRGPRNMYSKNNAPNYQMGEYQKQSQPCYDNRYGDNPSLYQHHSKDQYPSEMVKILLEENSNLKEQNKYLHTKLREISNKQSELVETVLEYQTIMAALNAQNEQLQKEVLYFSERANNRVDKLGKKLGKLLNKNQHVRHQRQQTVRDMQQSHSNIDSRQRQQQIYSNNRQSAPYLLQPPLNPFKRIKSQQRMHQRLIDQSSHNIQNHNNQFQSLLYACRMQINPQKRKQLRRRLVSLTYKKNPLNP